MPVFLICVIAFFILVLIITIGWFSVELFKNDIIMAGILTALLDLGAIAAWIFCLIHYVIPKF